jgi:hypothetical protein
MEIPFNAHLIINHAENSSAFLISKNNKIFIHHQESQGVIVKSCKSCIHNDHKMN